MAVEDEAVVVQILLVEKGVGRVRGGEVCVFRSLHVDESVDAW